MVKNFLNLLKHKIQTNQKFFLIKPNKQIINILKKLIEINIVLKIIFLNKQSIQIELNPILFKYPGLNIRYFLKNSNNQSISNVVLKKLAKKHLIFLLYTNSGVLTSQECLSKNLAGIPLFYIKIT